MTPPRKRKLAHLLTLSASSTQGWLKLGNLLLRCALGRTGARASKREGDGATPVGSWPVRRVHYRSDRLARPTTAAPVRALRSRDGWCDESDDPNYNRLVRLPYPASAETMCRDDHLYDVVVELGYNDCPRVRGRGSAIFVHLARPGYLPTAGCIALSPRALRALLAHLDRRTQIVVRAGQRPVQQRSAAASTT